MKRTAAEDRAELASTLTASARNRRALVDKLGCVPESILRLRRGKLSRELFTLQHEQPWRSPKTHVYHQRKAARWKAAGYGSNTVSQKITGHGRLGASTMPAELVAFFIHYYSRRGETYLDPFMGQGVRMQVAKRFGLHYYGYDASREFCRFVDGVRKRIDDGTTTLSTTCGDSRHPTAVPDGIGDFSFHSPPYWDVEYYGPEPAQLGTGKTYRQFLDGLGAVAAAWLPKFKPGAWHVVNVGDFRKGGVFYPYHADAIDVFVRAGWLLHDLWIVEGLVGGMSRVFGAEWADRKTAPRVHEYALVFQAPR